MDLVRFGELDVWINLVLFGAGATAIWGAGTRLSRYADAIAERTGVARAFIGALLLGGITSLPEGATTVAASAIGNAPLAVNNLIGGVAMQVAILAVADAVVPGRALSARIRDPVVLLEAALLILVLGVAAAGIVVGDVGVLGVGAWSSAVLALSLLSFFLIHRHQRHRTWEPEAPPRDERPDEEPRDTEPEEDRDAEPRDPAGAKDGGNGARRYAAPRLVLYTSLAGVVILAAGFVVARTGDALAEQTGLGASFVGVLFVAVATSLPEVSTTVGAVRLGQYGMAYSNVFGANILDVSVLFLADLVFVGGPVLGEVGVFTQVAALLGVTLTAVYMVGMLERRKRVVLGMGLDSIAVLALYAGGMFLLYTLR